MARKPDPSQKPELYLIKDNSPGENPLHQRRERKYAEKYEGLLREERKKHSDEVVDLYLNYLRQKAKSEKRFTAAIAAVSGAGVVIIGYLIATLLQSKPAEIHLLEKDLNGDTIPDACVLRKDGHKVPMYGMRTLEGIKYVTGEEMSKRPHDILDYQELEEKLNREF